MAIVAPHAGRIRHLFYGHVHRPVAGSWLGIPTTTLRGTNHQCWLDFEEQNQIPGSHEPPAYAVVLIDERVVVHTHDYLDASPKFSLADPDWRDEKPIRKGRRRSLEPLIRGSPPPPSLPIEGEGNARSSRLSPPSP